MVKSSQAKISLSDAWAVIYEAAPEDIVNLLKAAIKISDEPNGGDIYWQFKPKLKAKMDIKIYGYTSGNR